MIKDDFYEVLNGFTSSRIIQKMKKENCAGYKVFGIVLTDYEINVFNMVYADTELEAKKMNAKLRELNFYKYKWDDCNHYSLIKFEIKSIEEFKNKEAIKRTEQPSLLF